MGDERAGGKERRNEQLLDRDTRDVRDDHWSGAMSGPASPPAPTVASRSR